MSLFETLEGVTAAEASQSATPSVGTIAVEVNHTALYLDITIRFATVGYGDSGFESERNITMMGHQAISDAVRTAAAEYQYRYHHTDTNQRYCYKTQRLRFVLLRKAASATNDYLHRRLARREVVNQVHAKRIDKRYT